MAIRLYNTLTRSKDDFRPIDPKNVRLYVCGPTVYDDAHIGNARPVIVFDLLFRLLRHVYGADRVTYARNITDIDDKINARAFERSVTIRTLTDGTTKRFHDAIRALGVLMPEDVNLPGRDPRFFEPRATDHIEEMKALCEKLVARGHAYVAEEHVLFSVPSMAAYGRLSRRPLDDMIAGARVDVAPYKRSEMDFVLWKPSRDEHEPGWPSPCGIATPGRPGWHIECSAMSMAKLLVPFGGGLSCDDPTKNVFDIHGGGIDLVFPHHENEIAQSCCAFGTEVMANVWMHNGFLQVEGQKMSKSLGNFVTIDELLNTADFGGRTWAGEVLRLAMLKTHYRQPIDWTVKALEEAAATLADWRGIAREFVANPTVDDQVFNALADDLNVSAAIARLHQLRSAAKNDIDAGRRFTGSLRLMGFFEASFNREFPVSFDQPIEEVSFSRFVKTSSRLSSELTTGEIGERLAEQPYAERIGAILSGLKTFSHQTTWRALRDLGESGVDFDRALSLNVARLAARRAKNFAESDRIRDELAAMGIQLKDGKDPATGEPTTTWEVKP